MKKILIYLLFFIFICFVLPAVLTRRTISTTSVENTNSESQSVVENTEGQEQTNSYEYKKYGEINLLHKNSGEIEKVNIDDYLCNVVSA